MELFQAEYGFEDIICTVLSGDKALTLRMVSDAISGMEINKTFKESLLKSLNYKLNTMVNLGKLDKVRINGEVYFKVRPLDAPDKFGL